MQKEKCPKNKEKLNSETHHPHPMPSLQSQVVDVVNCTSEQPRKEGASGSTMVIKKVSLSRKQKKNLLKKNDKQRETSGMEEQGPEF